MPMTTKTTMNLTRDPWIPVLWQSGERSLVSLTELFVRSHEIRDLSVKPHEKIALLRLLICIAQAALEGPQDFDAWEQCRVGIPRAAEAYLNRWQSSFELFGDGLRFLQIPDLRMNKADAEGNPATKLDIMLATGNGATLFDNAGGDARPLADAHLALALLTFQCFSPGGRIGVAQWNGADTPGKGSSNHAPCIPSGMLHTFILGDTLLKTIHWNLLNMEEAGDFYGDHWGKPIWEYPITSIADGAAIRNASLSYLGRLVPLSRAIRLNPGGYDMILANGIDYPPYPTFRESSSTLVLRKDEPGVLGVSLERSLWRQLSAITVKRRSDGICGPLPLRNLDGAETVTLWIGALSTDKAKIEDVVEAVYDIPAGMFEDGGRKLYEEGVDFANTWQQALSAGIKSYAGCLKLEPSPVGKARHYFWTAIEQHVPTLFRLAADPESAGPVPDSAWGQAVKTVALEAYQFACPHQTPRQIEACAIGLQQMHLIKAKETSRRSKKPQTSQPPIAS